MGLNLLASKSSEGSVERSYRAASRDNDLNPDPRHFTILRERIHHRYLVLLIRYDGCTNYEGEKVLVFDKGMTVEDLKRQEWIDPYFAEYGIHPLARFVPTDRGWEMAMLLCQALWGVKQGS